jgi:hypothetical protein
LLHGFEFFLAVHMDTEAVDEGKPASQAGALAKRKFVILSSSQSLFSPGPFTTDNTGAFTSMEFK